MNILFEPFHRWAATQPVGVPVLDLRVASASVADDLALLGTSLADIVLLVNAYQRWCRLLGVTLNLSKTQIWSLQAHPDERVVLPLALLSWMFALPFGLWAWSLGPMSA